MAMKHPIQKSEEILKKYQNEAEEILYQMMRLLEIEQKKADNATYKKILEEVHSYESK